MASRHRASVTFQIVAAVNRLKHGLQQGNLAILQGWATTANGKRVRDVPRLTFAIGDVHGERYLLERAFAAITTARHLSARGDAGRLRLSRAGQRRRHPPAAENRGRRPAALSQGEP